MKTSFFQLVKYRNNGRQLLISFKNIKFRYIVRHILVYISFQPKLIEFILICKALLAIKFQSAFYYYYFEIAFI